MNKMTTAIIQARMGSTRLPGKVFMSLGTTTVLGYLINRLRHTNTIDKIVIAIPGTREDKQLYRYIVANFPQINVFVMPITTASSNNVLRRYYEAALRYNADPIVRITSDCPLIDPRLIDCLVNLYSNGNYDYCSLINLPDGLDCEIFSFNVLKRCFKEAILRSDLEHVTTYILKNKDKFRIKHLSPIMMGNISKYRFTIDQQEDLNVVRALVADLDNNDEHVFGVEDMVHWANRNSSIIKINAHIKRNEGYSRSLENDNEVIEAWQT